MVYIPQIDETTKRVLGVIRARGVVSGWQAMSEASVNPDQLSDAANKLISIGLISAKGVTSPSEISNTYFNVLPSSVDFADLVFNAPSLK